MFSIAEYILKPVQPSTEWYSQNKVNERMPVKRTLFQLEKEDLRVEGFYPLSDMIKQLLGDEAITSRDSEYMDLYWKFKAIIKNKKFCASTLERGCIVNLSVGEVNFLAQMAPHNGSWYLKVVERS